MSFNEKSQYLITSAILIVGLTEEETEKKTTTRTTKEGKKKQQKKKNKGQDGNDQLLDCYSREQDETNTRTPLKHIKLPHPT